MKVNDRRIAEDQRIVVYLDVAIDYEPGVHLPHPD